MARFVQSYLQDRKDAPLNIADIGAMDVNGSYKPLFDAPSWSYTGVDLAAGKNVDVVLTSPYDWPMADAEFDVVVSGQALEHVEFVWQTVTEVARVLKPGGLCCLIAPSAGPEHRYPVDCWRIYPDGMRALAKFAKLETVDVYSQWKKDEHPDLNPVWKDTVLIAQKPL
ncbi:MAG: class I SAM-dependent methyltransferase [Oceanococcus sp.]